MYRFQTEGPIQVDARFANTEGGAEVASLGLEVVPEALVRELWDSVQRENDSSQPQAAIQQVLCSRWPGGAGVFNAERERQRACWARMVQAQSEPERQRYLRSRPIRDLARDFHREQALDTALENLRTRGWQLDEADHFDRWFYQIRWNEVNSVRRRTGYRLEVSGDPDVLASVPWLEPVETPEDGFSGVSTYRRALQAPGGSPGSISHEPAFDELFCDLELEESDRGAIHAFLQRLRHAREKHLEPRILTFGQRLHLQRLSHTSPWRSAAADCLALMEQITHEQSSHRAPLVGQFGDLLVRFAGLGIHCAPPNLACGRLMHRFLDHFLTLRRLAHSWTLVQHCEQQWSAQQSDLCAFRAWMESGVWRNNLDAADQATLSGYFQRWWQQVNAPGFQAQDPGGVQLLLLWLSLRADETLLNGLNPPQEPRLRDLAGGWWESRLRQQAVMEADQAVAALYAQHLCH